MKKSIFYYDELEFDNLYVDLCFNIKLNDKNNEIFINKISYDYEYKNDIKHTTIRKSYNINLTINLGSIYNILDMYYNIMNIYKYPINKNLYINMVLFGYDYIEDFLFICNNQEKKLFLGHEKTIKIFKHQLNKICNILNYHIYKGLNDLNIYENNIFNDIEYNNLMENLKKYQIVN